MSIVAIAVLSFIAGALFATLAAVSAIRTVNRRADDRRQRKAWDDMAAELRREQYERGLRESRGW